MEFVYNRTRLSYRGQVRKEQLEGWWGVGWEKIEGSANHTDVHSRARGNCKCRRKEVGRGIVWSGKVALEKGLNRMKMQIHIQIHPGRCGCLWATYNIPLIEVLPEAKWGVYSKLASRGFGLNSNSAMFVEGQTFCNELSNSLINQILQ